MILSLVIDHWWWGFKHKYSVVETPSDQACCSLVPRLVPIPNHRHLMATLLETNIGPTKSVFHPKTDVPKPSKTYLEGSML